MSRKARANRIGILFAGILVVTGGAAVLARTMSVSALNLLSDNAALTTAIATLLLALVAILQWRTFEKTDRTLKLGQRPWIGIADIQTLEWPLQHDGRLVFKLSFVLKNVGHSPATVLVRFRVLQDIAG